MIIQAEVSLYPLRTNEIGGAIESFVGNLEQQDMKVVSGSMSTRISGDSKSVFAALAESFDKIADQGEVVLIAKVSNACPLERAAE